MPSYPQRLMQAGHSGGQFRRLETFCDQTLIHEVKSIGELAGKAEVLFHRQDGMPCCCRVCSAQPLRRASTGASPSVGSSSSGILTPGAHLRAARQFIPLALGPFQQIGKQRINFIRRHAMRGNDRQQQVFLDAERCEDTPLLGDIADPGARCTAMAGVSESLPANSTAPLGLRKMPMPEPRAVLPRPLWPGMVTVSASQTVRSTPCGIWLSSCQACSSLPDAGQWFALRHDPCPYRRP